jgi:hypothetical protein
MSLTKINSKGEYQPIYGYTVISMMNDLNVATRIEQFIKKSSLHTFFSPLPAHTYHMTVFNIYVVGGDLIQPVLDWVNKGNIVKRNCWLPDEVLAVENMSTFNCLKSEKELEITKSKLYVSKQSLGVVVQLDSKVQTIQSRLSNVYRHSGSPRELHITFAYGYNCSEKFTPQNMTDLFTLEKLVNDIFTDLVLAPPELYLFNSMDNYIPFKSFCTF